MVSQALTNRCWQKMMHRHAQRANKGMLAMVVLMLFFQRSTQSVGNGRHCLLGKAHKIEVHKTKAHKVQAMASKRDTKKKTQRWNILGFLNLDTHRFIKIKSATMFLGLGHTQIPKTNWLLEGDTNIKKEQGQREKKMIEKEKLKQT